MIPFYFRGTPLLTCNSSLPSCQNRLCEEVQNPEREVPKAMTLSVVAASITGFFYLVPILFVLPDIET